MPIFAQGYREWQGELRGRFFRWWVIAKTGIMLTGRSRWLRRFVLLAWMPLLYYGLGFFVVGQLTDVGNPDLARKKWQYMMMTGILGPELTAEFVRDPAQFRLAIWSLMLHLFLRYTQVFCVMIVVAIVGPRLVSEDLRTRALSLYFSKPLTRADYLLGKLAVVAFWVGMVTLGPALALYGLSIAFSPDLDTIAQTIWVVPRVVLFSLLLMIGTGAPMLALSSLARNPRFLGFIWAGVWVLSMVTSTVLQESLFDDRYQVDPHTHQVVIHKAEGDWTGLVSFSTNFHAVSFRLFDVGDQMEKAVRLSPRAERLVNNLRFDHHAGYSAFLIVCAAGLSLLIFTWRIGRPGEEGS